MRILISITLLAMLFSCNGPADPVISADFPGGNIVLVEQGKDTIRLLPDLSETDQDWFYWYFKASNISGRTLTFQFMMDNQFTAAGPSCSINNDRDWKWLGSDLINGNAFTYTFSKDDTVAYFSMALPYTQANFDEFMDQLGDQALLKKDTLAFSQEGRAIERIILGQETGEPDTRILLTVRHHACEMTTSYLLEGLIESVLHDPSLEYLRSHVEFMIIPFMDKDGVENGEQGKNRIPRDHNRDYSGKSLYASTAAIREQVPIWSEGKLRVALDLHCPWIKGDGNEWAYLVGKNDPGIKKEQIRFNALLEQNASGALKFRTQDYLAYGMAWNTENYRSKGQTFSQWAAGLEGIKMSTSLEFPYAMMLGEEVTPDRAREFGHAVALSIGDYLKGIK